MKQKLLLTNSGMPRWLKWLLRGLLIVVVLFIGGYFFMAWYVHNHKKEILTSITKMLNEDLNGKLAIGDMEPAFLEGFPQLSLNLNNVTIQDTMYATHKKLLLNSENFNISVNALALLRGTIEIKKIGITNASVNLFTDANGYTNTSVFNKSKKKSDGSSSSYPELRKFTLDNVVFSIDNLQKNKRYQFNIDKLKGNIDFISSGWEADLKLKTLVKSMAFSTKKGSFIKDKIVEGNFEITYNDAESKVEFLPNALEIGGEEFTVSAQFQSVGAQSNFAIKILNDEILWKNASALLSPNITSRLDLFDLSEPISVSCDIVGDFNAFGDPLIHVKAKIRDNTLDTPGGKVENCSFDGEFINNYIKKDGFSDKNSAVKLFNFTGDYAEIPVNMQKVFILDFDNPYAVGDFNSTFDVAKINNLIDDDLMVFSNGKASVKLQYKADIVNYKLTKPTVQGLIQIKDADVKYVSRNLDFKNISVALNFVKDNLDISKIHFQTGKSTVEMKGNIQNFLNLYYTNPDKIILNWNVYSPQLYLGEFMGFLGSRKTKKISKRKSQGNFTEDVNALFERSNVNMKLRVDKLFYNKFSATNATADVFLTDTGIILKNGGFKHAGGNITLNGTLTQKGNANKYNLSPIVSHVDISQFFKSFNNFGLESLKAENLKGKFSTKANISGLIKDNGEMVPNSMYGNVAFNFQQGELVNFAPVKSVGKFAFPFRNLSNIDIYELNGDFKIAGEKVTINPMQINSSVINMDMEGVYSFGKGTEIFIDVPLRNPKKDKGITDEDILAKRRNRGIVVHLTAADGADGKVGLKLGGKNRDEDN